MKIIAEKSNVLEVRIREQNEGVSICIVDKSSADNFNHTIARISSEGLHIIPGLEDVNFLPTVKLDTGETYIKVIQGYTERKLDEQESN